MSNLQNEIIFEQLLEKAQEQVKDPDQAEALAERWFEEKGLEI